MATIAITAPIATTNISSTSEKPRPPRRPVLCMSTFRSPLVDDQLAPREAVCLGRAAALPYGTRRAARLVDDLDLAVGAAGRGSRSAAARGGAAGARAGAGAAGARA